MKKFVGMFVVPDENAELAQLVNDMKSETNDVERIQRVPRGETEVYRGWAIMFDADTFAALMAQMQAAYRELSQAME